MRRAAQPAPIAIPDTARRAVVGVPCLMLEAIQDQGLDVSGIPRDRLLRNWGLIDDADGEDRLTVAGVLLLARSPQRFFPHAYVSALRIPGTDIATPPIDQKRIEGRLFDLLSDALRFLDFHLMRRHRIRGLEPEVVIEFPVACLRETLVNAIAHRDYTIAGPVRLLVFDDRRQGRWIHRGNGGRESDDGRNARHDAFRGGRRVGHQSVGRIERNVSASPSIQSEAALVSRPLRSHRNATAPLSHRRTATASPATSVQVGSTSWAGSPGGFSACSAALRRSRQDLICTNCPHFFVAANSDSQPDERDRRAVRPILQVTTVTRRAPRSAGSRTEVRERARSILDIEPHSLPPSSPFSASCLQTRKLRQRGERRSDSALGQAVQRLGRPPEAVRPPLKHSFCCS